MVERFTPDIERGSSPDYDDPVMRPDEFGGYVRFSDYEAQIAGHRLSAKEATKNLIRATTAEAQFEEMTRSCIAERASRLAAEARADALAQEVERLRLPEGTLAKHGSTITIEFDNAEYALRAFDAIEYAMSREPAALANEEAGR